VLKRVVLVAVACLSVARPASAQSDATPTASAVAKDWSFFASAYTYIIPDDSNYGQPTVTADHGRLHLEGRYNYESRKTGSAWVGLNFSGDTLGWELTPIFGVVFGDLDGVAPGYKGSLSWRRLSLYSEGEVVIDASETTDSFFYAWSELTYSLTESLRSGLVVQRTHAYKTDRIVQRGIFVGYSYRRAEFTFCLFNPDDEKPTVAFSAGFRF
jgi:hypothetical protein